MNLRVAVYDDSDALRESLEFLIGSAPGITLAGLYAGCENIISDLAENNADVVLMDIDMPGINGIQATALVKSHYPDVNVLILTAFDDSAKIFEALHSGATGYLLKKTPPAKILEAIAEISNGGAPMTANIARKVLDFFSTKKTEPANSYDLSSREKEVLSCLVKGESYKMITVSCAISIGTVCTHISNIYKKLHVNSKSEAVAKAIMENLTDH
ncbi:response regulator [Mucilaginibacter lutimaris]|uniref:Response regulator n=1 Tax=Mucilaginibacter lutimaris TaxID=931629 RepID=A0ABW2ZKZ4_9SPHI